MKKLILLSSFSVISMLPGSATLAQTTITPGGVIIQQPGTQSDSAAQQLAICIASLNSVQNESEGYVTLYGSYRPLAIDHAYRFAKPSNVPDDEMNRVGLRNRDGDDVWVGDVASVNVRTTNASNLSNLNNREIMELCLQRTPQFNSSPTPVAQPPYYSPQPQSQPPYYSPQPQPQPQPPTPVAQPSSSTILMVGNPSQPVPIDITAQISASLARRGLSPVACDLNPGVTVLVGQYIACAYPTPSYPAGRYTLRQD